MLVNETDERLHGPAVRSFIGHRVFPSLATNSLKLLVDSRDKGVHYVWIDPPWELASGERVVMSSADVPHHSEAAYEPRFREYAQRSDCLEGATLQAVIFVPDGVTEFHFGNDLILRLPRAQADPERGLWYSHWYAHIHAARAEG